MSKKILWSVVSGLMVLSLVLAACGPAAAPTTPTKPTTPTITTPTAPVQEKPQQEAAAPQKPKYGGTFTEAIVSDPTNWDSGLNRQSGALVGMVYQQYMSSDWRRGPGGSGVTNFAAGSSSLDDLYGPELAESWEMPAQGVWILKIRRGVHWQKPNTDAGRLMNGREMTADDIVSSLKRLFGTGQSWMHASQPKAMAAITIEKTGPWEVTLKTPVDYLTSFFWVVQGGGYNRVYPPEVVAKYGDMGNWRNAVGTGPFFLADYIPGSQLLFVRNPDYWETNPIGPGKGDQLPYVDTYRQLIIPDASTRMAALRTGKLDWMASIVLEDAKSLWQTSPKLEYLNYLSNNPLVFFMRTDKKDKPFSDKKVRQALMLATDFEGIKKNFYGGNAEIDVYPVNVNFKAAGAYIPLSEMPQTVQDLYKYNPEKAKQLLKEAGYPNGFKAKVVVSATASALNGSVDEVAIFKDMWAKVGIDVTLDIKENVVFTQITGARNYEEMLYRFNYSSWPVAFYYSPIRGTSVNNLSYINEPEGTDPVIEAAFKEGEKFVMINMPEFFKSYQAIRAHLMEQAYVIPRPTPYTYNFWWPWLKNFYGQGAGFIRYSWIDQDLKKSMGY